ncbi:hypothetical protein ACFE04_020631 [Oxalis oulophora]
MRSDANLRRQSSWRIKGKGKFSLPDTEEMERILLSIFGRKFRNHKHKFKQSVLKKAEAKLIEMWKTEIGVSGELVWQHRRALRVRDFLTFARSSPFLHSVLENSSGHNASWKNQQDTYPLWRD